MSLFCQTRPCSLKRYAIYLGSVFLIFYMVGFLMVIINLVSTDRGPNMVKNDHTPKIWPEDDPRSDRILDQMFYVPKIIENRTIVIALSPSASSWGVKLGRDVFLDESCNISNCILTEESSRNDADVLMFNRNLPDLQRRPPGQIWILYNLENPVNSQMYNILDGQLNYTATYRLDSDIVTPYEKYVEYSDERFSMKKMKERPGRNYAAGKSKQVAWFVSNCVDQNGRLEYARNLSNYIQVDIYGGCGDKSCNRGSSECFDMLNKDYKFYLAFENANCRDYVTEKFFVNALQNNIIPIVMGASPQVLSRLAPKHSFIHVDHFSSPADLANFLHILDKNDAKYNEYFRWRETEDGGFINTKFWCRLCALMNNPKPKIYDSVQEWWNGNGVCGDGGTNTFTKANLVGSQ